MKSICIMPIMLKAGLGLVFAIALAAATPRTIEIISPDNTAKRSGNLQYGPWVYEATKVGSLVGKVKDLEIVSLKATLEAPQGKTIQESEGDRTATFTNEITVKRNRMTAKGSKLTYKENNGLGTLDGPATMHQDPKEKGDDPVDLTGKTMTFNVDNNVSTSEGNVVLKSGKQEGRSSKVYYEEDSTLAIFNDDKQVDLLRKRDDGDLVIKAKEVRSLTDDKRLIATGNVTLMDGDLTTSGTELYYDDNSGIAIVIGNPAKSENVKEGFKLTGEKIIRHDVKKHLATRGPAGYKLPVKEFEKAVK